MLTKAAPAQRYEPAVPLDAIHPHPENVNEGDIGAIAHSVEANGWYGAVLVQETTGRIIAGKHRWLSARAAGLDAVPVLWVDVDDDAARRIMLVDNRTARLGADDLNALTVLLQELARSDRGLAGTGYDGDDLDELLAALTRDPADLPGDEPSRTLAERFLVPPFSVLDARQETWRDRDHAWRGLGASGDHPVLSEVAYRWWCPPGGVVFDPFAVDPIPGVVAGWLDRNYLGAVGDETQAIGFAAAWSGVRRRPDAGRGEVAWHAGRWEEALASLREPADFLFVRLRLTDRAEWEAAVRAAVGALRPDRFALAIVDDPTPGAMTASPWPDVIAAFVAAGAEYHNEVIVTIPPPDAGAEFHRDRRVGCSHRTVLTFAKGDAKAATRACGPVEVADPAALFGEVLTA